MGFIIRYTQRSVFLFLILSILVLLIINFTSAVTIIEESEADLSTIKTYTSTRATNSNPARLEVSKTIDRNLIFVKGSELNPEQAEVTITVEGKGYPGVEFDPQDIVFVMDNSDSMDENDNEYKRIEALRLYLKTMIPPDDRAAVIKFDSKATLLNDHHLTFNYSQIFNDLPLLWHTAGLTNLGDAVAMANKELINYGDEQNKTLVQILLTDGRPEPPENNVTKKTIAEAAENNIKIFTVGLGEDHDASLLKWISNETKGKYYYAKEAEDLLEIYNEISNQFRNFTAGSDPNPNDDDPMVRDVLPEWIVHDPNTFSIQPDYIGSYFGGTTKIEWNISKIDIGKKWTVSYNISSTQVGEEVVVTVFGHARVMYKTQSGNLEELWFDELTIKVLPEYSKLLPGPPPPPPPPPLPPPPPASGFPIPAPPMATPVPISIPSAAPVTAGAIPTAIPAEYVFAGFLGLSVAERIRQRRVLKTRQKVAIGV